MFTKKSTIVILEDSYNFKNCQSLLKNITKYKQVLYAYTSKEFAIYWVGLYSVIIEVIYFIKNKKNEDVIFSHDDYPLTNLFLYGVEKNDVIRKDFLLLSTNKLPLKKGYFLMISFFVAFLFLLFILDWYKII